MDVEAMVSLAVLGVIKREGLKVLSTLLYMFYGSCRRISKALSLALESMSLL
jgi:hypothetical protein